MLFFNSLSLTSSPIIVVLRTLSSLLEPNFHQHPRIERSYLTGVLRYCLTLIDLTNTLGIIYIRNTSRLHELSSQGGHSTIYTMETELISSLQIASAQWIAFSLETRKTSLDKAITAAKANNAQSQSARKLLAESTKSFKKCIKTTEQSISMNDEEKGQFQKLSSSCKDIVKSYQEEIDKLTKRCKASDSLVTDLNKGLNEIMDPVPLMKNAAEHLDSMSGQVSHLLKGMEEMQRELESKHKEYSQSVKGHNDEMFQLKKLLEEANSKNKLLEKELKSVKTESSSQQKKSYMSKEEKEELIELRKEVAEYEVEFKNLKNQDITIKKLNAKIEDLIANQEEELQRELK
jgi:Chromosome segregation ATPases